jgi:hypothetical protein
MADDRAVWVYAVTGDLDAAVLDDLEGIGGQGIRALAAGALTAVVGSVDRDAFSEKEFERQLSDPARLEALAWAHHEVISAVAAAGPVLPLRLATVYRDDDRVRALLADRRADFAKTLRWLAGRGECGVKVWAEPGALSGEDAGERPTPTARPAGGAAAGGAEYLSRRRAQLAAKADGRQRAAHHGAEIHSALSGLAVAGRSHQLQDARVTGEPGMMVLNGAYLVEIPRLPQFAESAGGMVGELPGFRVDVTGPWPPYSFADGPEDPDCPGGPER